MVSRKFESQKVYKVGKWHSGWVMGDRGWVMGDRGWVMGDRGWVMGNG